LTLNGYRVLLADSVDKAESFCENEHVKLVITDVLMPEKDGIEMIMWLKNNYKEIPIIAISGGGQFVGAKYLKTAGLLGADKVLEKPLVAEELVAAVSECLSKCETDSN